MLMHCCDVEGEAILQASTTELSSRALQFTQRAMDAWKGEIGDGREKWRRRARL